MSFSRVNGAGWSSGDKFTSTQANALDTNITSCFDIRSSQTNTVQSVTTLTGAGRILPNYEAAADFDHTYAVADGISVIDASSGLTANRAYTLSNTGAAAGDTVLVLGNSTYNVTVNNNGGTALFVVGATGTAHGMWAEFRHNGTNWVLLRSPVVFYPTRMLSFRPDAYCSTARDSTQFATGTLLDTFDVITGTQIEYLSLGAQAHLKTVNTATSKSYAYRQALDSSILPQGHKLTSVVVTLTGAAAHGGLPQQMPAVMMSAFSNSTAVAATLTSTTWSVDTSANTAAYQASHTITYTPDQNNTIDHSAYSYFLYFLGEGGANALANLTVQHFAFTFSLL